MEKMVIIDGYGLVKDFNSPSHPDSPAAWYRILQSRVLRGVAYARSLLDWAKGVRKNYIDPAKNSSPLLDELKRYVEAHEEMANDVIDKAKEVKKGLLSDLTVPSGKEMMLIRSLQEDLNDLVDEHQRCVQALADAKRLMLEVQMHSEEHTEKLGTEIELLRRSTTTKKREQAIRHLQVEIEAVRKNMDKTLSIFKHHSRRERLCIEEVVKKADELLDEVCRLKGENQSKLLNTLHEFYVTFEHAGRAKYEERLKDFHHDFHIAENDYGVTRILNSMKEGIHYYLFANMPEWLTGTHLNEPLPFPMMVPVLNKYNGPDIKKKTNITVAAIREQIPLLPDDLHLKKGTKIRQTGPMGKTGLSYGWIRPHKFRADRKYGFYPGDIVQPLVPLRRKY